MKLNTAILREISFQLTEGNPWWGMLLANEYIDQTHPLRAAFEMRFTKSVGTSSAGRGTLAAALLRGKRRSELSKALLSTVGSRGMRERTSPASALGTRTAISAGISATRRAAATSRLALRQRNTQVARFSSGAAFQPARAAKVTHLRPVAL